MDIDKAKEIHSSMNWAEICDELELWIASETKKLRICTPAQLEAVQWTINALERVKELPQIVIDREE